jgi:hypothetical protein
VPRGGLLAAAETALTIGKLYADMNSERAQAYGRVTATLADVGPSKLTPPEQELIREAADALFFCEDIGSDSAAQTALEDVRALAERLVEADRWLDATAVRLVADIEGCGPLTPVA